MLRSDSLFGKKDNAAQPGTNPGTSAGTSPSPFAPSNTFGAPSSNVGKPPMSAPGMAPAPSSESEGGSKLIVGPNIKLKGVEITDCDTLVVEGRVEATMNSRVIRIAATGSFKGSAEIDIAEIYGEFEGTLTVREKLVIYSTGRVSGKIRYGKVVIEEGGQIAGDVQTSTGRLSSQHVSSVGSASPASSTASSSASSPSAATAASVS